MRPVRKQAVLPICLICVFFGIQSLCICQQPLLSTTRGSAAVNSGSFHGTVNIILANRNGIVAVTDSRLSSGSPRPTQPHYVGQKLFKLDEHTICTIAGTYSLEGVTIAGNESVGAALVSQIIGQFSGDPQFTTNSTLAKAQILSDALAYRFNLALLLDQASFHQSQQPIAIPQSIELTLASYGEHKQIIKVRIDPIRSGSLLYFEPHLAVNRTVTTGFTYVLAGIAEINDFLIQNPYLALTGTSNPSLTSAISVYARSLEQDDGDSLTTEELKQFALSMESFTSLLVPSVVGDAPETAVLESNKLTFDANVSRTGSIDLATVFPNSSKFTFFLFSGGGVSHAPRGIAIGPAILGVVPGATFTDIKNQGLDGFCFTDSTFDHVGFTYEGRLIALFDPNNKITNSTLRLGPNVKPDDPFVIYMLRTFPGLTMAKVQ